MSARPPRPFPMIGRLTGYLAANPPRPRLRPRHGRAAGPLNSPSRVAILPHGPAWTRRLGRLYPRRRRNPAFEDREKWSAPGLKLIDQTRIMS